MAYVARGDGGDGDDDEEDEWRARSHINRREFWRSARDNATTKHARGGDGSDIDGGGGGGALQPFCWAAARRRVLCALPCQLKAQQIVDSSQTTRPTRKKKKEEPGEEGDDGRLR